MSRMKRGRENNSREKVAIDTKKMANKKASSQEDHFQRLPEELLLYIFNRVSDLKSLCLCSLVSKHFAFIISHVQTVTIQFPSSEPHSIESYKKTFAFFREIRNLESDQIPAHLDMLSLQKLKLPVFLENFRKLESIYLEYNSSRNTGDSSLIMWKAKCNSSAMIERFVTVLPVSVHNKTEYDELDQDDEEEVSQVDKWNRISSQINDCFWLSFGCYTEWLCLICMLIKSHSSLKSVTVADPEKHSRFVLKNEQLVNVRSNLNEVERLEMDIAPKFKMAWVPFLELPLSGYVMRRLCLIMVKVINTGGSGEEDGEFENLMAWDIDKEDNLLGVVKEMLKNQQDKIEISR